MKYLSSIMQSANLTQEELTNFLRNSKDKEFLFGKDIQEHLNQLYTEGVRLSSVKEILEDKPVGEERERLVYKSHDLLMWFKDQFEISKQLFGKYLKIDKK